MNKNKKIFITGVGVSSVGLALLYGYKKKNEKDLKLPLCKKG